MLSLQSLHGDYRVLINPVQVTDIYVQGGTSVRVVGDDRPIRVKDTPADIAKLVALWNRRFDIAFREQFGIDLTTQVISSIGWQGSKLVLDIVDIAELREVDQ